MPPPGRHVLLWDGDCAFCARWVGWVLRRSRGLPVSVMPYRLAMAWLPPEVAALAPRQAWLRLADGRYVGGGDILPALLRLWGRPRLAAVLAGRPLCWCVRAGYRLVARHRRWFARLPFPTTAAASTTSRVDA
jgi:predicted DCC family thiol-disulfide oxidoreductase YuxK